MSRSFAVILTIAGTLLGSIPSFGATGGPISVHEVAALLNIPAERLRLLDETANFQRRKGQAYLTVVRFTRDDGLVTDLWVETATAGKLWTTQTESELASYLPKRVEVQTLGESDMQRFDFLWGRLISYGGDGKGHIGMSMDGPRGACFRALVTLPQINMDVALSLASSEKDASELDQADKLLQGQIATN